MKSKPPTPIHTWLVWMLASRSVGSYALDSIEEAGLGESDFRVLEVLLHKGPIPVNGIGPKVNLNPGSVSVAVDRLYKRGLVNRVEDSQDRRIRIVSLTSEGTALIDADFPKAHCRDERSVLGTKGVGAGNHWKICYDESESTRKNCAPKDS